MKRSREPEEEYVPGAIEQVNELTGRVNSSETGAPATKITGLDEFAVDDSSDTAMKCHLPPHRDALEFKTYADYETHYKKAHSNRCFECGKNLPSEHFLSLHIEECHDAFAAVKREKGEHTFSCFVEGCDRKCGTPQKRRMHLIDKHQFPKNYFFAVTKEGIDGRQSLLLEGGHHRRRSSIKQQPDLKGTRRRQSLQQPESSTTEPENDVSPSEHKSEQDSPHVSGSKDVEMEDLAGAMSSLQFVPPSIRFGRGGRAGFSKK